MALGMTSLAIVSFPDVLCTCTHTHTHCTTKSCDIKQQISQMNLPIGGAENPGDLCNEWVSLGMRPTWQRNLFPACPYLPFLPFFPDAPGAVFKSVTDRMLPIDGDAKFKPGPGHYNPVAEVKRSYFYNVHSVWVWTQSTHCNNTLTHSFTTADSWCYCCVGLVSPESTIAYLRALCCC